MKTALIHTITNEVTWGSDGVNLSSTDTPLRINLNSDLTNNASGFVQNRTSNQLTYNVDGTARPLKIVGTDEIGGAPATALELLSLHVNVTEKTHGSIANIGVDGVNIDTRYNSTDKNISFYPAKLDERVVYVDGGVVLEKNGTNTNSGANQEYHQIILDLGGTLDGSSVFLGHSLKFKNSINFDNERASRPWAFLYRDKDTKVIQVIGIAGSLDNGIGISQIYNIGNSVDAILGIKTNFTLDEFSSNFVPLDEINSTVVSPGDIISAEINFNGYGIVRRTPGSEEIMVAANNSFLQNTAFNNIEFVPFFHIHSETDRAVNSFDDWSLIGYDF